MFGLLWVSCAAAWTALVVDVVIESAPSGGSTIQVSGRAFAVSDPAHGIYLMAGLAASAALLLTAALASWRGRRRERRMAAELDERWEQLSIDHAGVEARQQLLEWRVGELQTQADVLAGKRDELLEEMASVRQRTARLREAAREHKRALASGPGGTADGELTIVPDLDTPGEEQIASPVDITSLVPTRARREGTRRLVRAQAAKAKADQDEATPTGKPDEPAT